MLRWQMGRTFSGNSLSTTFFIIALYWVGYESIKSLSPHSNFVSTFTAGAIAGMVRVDIIASLIPVINGLVEVKCNCRRGWYHLYVSSFTCCQHRFSWKILHKTFAVCSESLQILITLLAVYIVAKFDMFDQNREM